LKKILASGGALLMASALGSKILGLFRDRLFVEHFADTGQIDYIFAAFRIPDFFFFLLIGGTVSTLFLPRIVDLKSREKWQFFSSFFWGVFLFFGLFCGIASFFPEFFVKIFAAGFTGDAQVEVAQLARYLFGSVFFLAISSVFSAAQQAQQKFLSIALAPILYTGTICIGVYFFAGIWGLSSIGLFAILGAFLHLAMNSSAYFLTGGKLGYFWKKPTSAWNNFGTDLSFRTVNNAAFQINQSADVWIASFLAVGSVSAYQIGANLGMVLFSIIGIPIARAIFPKLTNCKNNIVKQKAIIFDSLKWVLLMTIPATFIGFWWAEFWLSFLFNLDGDILRMSTIVLKWVILSLPFAAVLPILSRIFLANDNVITPMKISATSLFIATITAYVLALKVFPPETAVLGLAIGTFLANFLSATLFGYFVWKKK